MHPSLELAWRTPEGTAGRPAWTGRTVWEFAGHELDELRYELRREGARVPLEPLVFELLVVLARHQGALVPRQKLVARLWPDTVVTPASLTRLVSQARRALGDDGHGQAIVRTVRGRGYQLGVPVFRCKPGEIRLP